LLWLNFTFKEISILVLTRKLGEKLIISGGGLDGLVEVTVIAVNREQVRLGIDAPDDVTVDREEIHQKKMRGEWRD
jgi:carbon storage regulator